ncbi:hypothetical protein Q2T70_17220 [Klebsiella oxytoca]|uniref:hypothetical protein n=1 Tax=Klebsiella oxytoca TaxID=571 RepID=UPI00265DC16F|nr:hypothetical protein [Klebsiella oxytoca]WKM70155.1 hypothetical protein Q2T70_17220 [Klebsiella oxytoca]
MKKIIISLITLLFSMATQAVQIDPYLNTSGHINILVSGEINPGDFKKFRKAIDYYTDAGFTIDTLLLNSPGGAVVDATGMAFTIKSSGADTAVGKDQLCASSCFMLFAAGKNRYLIDSSKVGVHQISLGGQSNLKSLGLSVQMSDMYDFFRIPENISYRMLKTPPSQVYWLTPNDKANFNTPNTVFISRLSRWNYTVTEQSLNSASPESLFKLASVYYLGLGVSQDYNKARRIFEKASKAGFLAATHKLGVIFARGYGVNVDEDLARKYFEIAAAGGYGASLNNLAVFEADRNMTKAIRMNEKLIDKQYDNSVRSFAFGQLGDFYYYGKGVEKNAVKAVKYYRQGAVLGDTNCQYMYGYILISGLIGSNQSREGNSWLNTACAGGNEDSCNLLGR